MLALLALIATAAGAANRPNLLLILTDNESPTLLGAYGNTEIRTPNIDRLAAAGHALHPRLRHQRRVLARAGHAAHRAHSRRAPACTTGCR